MVNLPEGSRATTWILGIFVVFLCFISAANFYLLLEDRGADAATEGEEEEADPVIREPIFVTVGPMTVNLGDDSYGRRLLYTGLSLRVRDEETRDQLMTHMPEVHSRLLLLLSSHSAGELIADGGKEKLAKEVLDLFSEPLAENRPPLAVEAVLFTDFIVQ